MGVIIDTSLGVFSQTGLLYGLVLLIVFGVCAVIQYAWKLFSRSRKTRDGRTLLPSTSDNQRQPRVDYVEIKKEPIDLEFQLDRSRTASPI